MPDEKDLKANLETINLREKERLAPETGREKITSPEREPDLDTKKAKDQAEMPIIDTTGGGEIAPGQAAGASDSQRQRQIEAVLAKDMEEFYLEMNESKRREFKTAGEETAGKINELANRGKATARKILELIKKWLSLIPGVNKFFLEQEAKIKTDEIIKIANNKN